MMTTTRTYCLGDYGFIRNWINIISIVIKIQTRIHVKKVESRAVRKRWHDVATG